MKFSYPVKDIDSLDSFFNFSGLRKGGFYPISVSNKWHGGVHIEGDGKIINAIADGEIIACKMPDKYDVEKEDNVDCRYSNAFVLIKHKYEYTNDKKEKKQLIFYSLYNHLLLKSEMKGNIKSPKFCSKTTDALKLTSTSSYKLRKSSPMDTKDKNYGMPTGKLVSTGEYMTKEPLTADEASPNHWAKKEGFTKVKHRDSKTIGFIKLDASNSEKVLLATGEYDSEKFPTGKVINRKIKVEAGERIGYTGYCETADLSGYKACHIEVFTIDETELKDFLKEKKIEFDIVKDDPNDFVFDGNEKGELMKKVVKEIDENKDGEITAAELQRAIKKKTIAKKLTSIISYHKTEWAGTDISNSYADEIGKLIDKFLDKMPACEEKKKLSEKKDKLLERFKKRVATSGIWSEVDELKSKMEVFYFHPIAFVEQMKRLETENKIVTFSSGLEEERRKLLSNESIDILERAAQQACIKSLNVTSTIRYPRNQATAMYDNMEKGKNMKYQQPGEDVKAVYQQCKKDKLSKEDTINKMIDKIEELSKENKRVSLHCVSVESYKKLNVVDISYPNPNTKEFINALDKEPNVKRIFHDMNDITNTTKVRYLKDETCVHIEISQ